MWVYYALFSSDFPYWLIKKVARRRLEAIYDVTPALRANMTAAEQAFVDDMVDGMLPVTSRLAGLRNEAAAAHPNALYELHKIAAPTLVFHARDDGINAFTFGLQTAEQIPDAQFVALDTGGHLLLGHHTDIRQQANAFFRRFTTAWSEVKATAQST